MDASPSERQPYRECLAVVESVGEPVTASEVATQLPWSVSTTTERLEGLAEAGNLRTKVVGEDTRVWWCPTPEGDAPTATEPDDPAVTETATTVFERISDAFFALDEEFRFTYLNDRAEELIGVTEAEVAGSLIWEVFPAAVGSTFQESYERAMETQTTVTFQEYFGPLEAWFEVTAYPSESGLSVYFDDVTERVEQRHERERYRRIVETVGDGIYVVDGDGEFTLVNDAYAEMMGYSRGELLGSHVSMVADDETIDYAADIEAELNEGECSTATMEAELTDADGESFVAEANFALVSTEEGDPERVGVVRDVTDRKRRQDRLADQRENLQALNDLNGLVRSIMESVLQQSTRGEVEELVCERLASTDSYECAWIGETDPATESVTARAEAGTDGYAECADISTTAGERRGEGPAGRAARTGEMQVSQHLLESATFEPWKEAAREHGFRSSASVPLSADGTLYGLLNVYAARPEAFEDEERQALAELGEVVGQALAGIEQRRALTSDEVVELEFTVSDVFAGLDVDLPEEYTATFDRIVPTDDDYYLAYVDADEGFLTLARRLAARFEVWASVSVIDEREDGYRLEVAFQGPVVPSVIADQGGDVRRVTLDSGGYNAVVHLPHGADVRRVLERVREAYAESTVVTNRRTTRIEDATHRLSRTFSEELTDRQRTALEAAYFAGFFEWPRNSSGTEVAESLDVHPSTFHQHLRHAEAELLAALFEEL